MCLRVSYSIRSAQTDSTTITDVDAVRFEYNATKVDRAVALDQTYVDVTGKAYCGTMTIAPYRSLILMKSTVPSTPATPPDAGAGDAGGESDAGADGSDGGGDGASGCACTLSSKGLGGAGGVGIGLLVALAWARRRRAALARALIDVLNGAAGHERRAGRGVEVGPKRASAFGSGFVAAR